MECRSCGAEIVDGAHFCQNCGASIASAAVSIEPKSLAEKMRRGAAEVSDENELQLWAGGYAAKAMYGWWLAGGLAAVLCSVALMTTNIPMNAVMLGSLSVWAIVAAVLGLTLAYRKLSARYKLTSQRFIHQHGILKRVTDRIEVIDMDDVSYEQGLVQRLLGVGTIQISSTDRSHPELALWGIADVERVAEMIDDVRRQERLRRGLHIEAI